MPKRRNNMNTGHRQENTIEVAAQRDRPTVISDKSPAQTQGERNRAEMMHEYTETNNNIRHYSNLRFAIFTVYFAVLGGLMYVAFGFLDVKTGDPRYTKLWARIIGLVVSLLFLVLELNCEHYLKAYLKVGKEIENKLGYKQLTERDETGYKGLLRPQYATLSIYGGLIVFWIVMLVWMIASLIEG
jgi:hypothetical protein